MSRVLTLLYHRVVSYDKDVQLLAVTPEHFEDQMRWLKANYKIVALDEDWNSEEGDAVCITFDDGYRDNFLTAVPILNEMQIPATIFITTGNMNTEQELWWDELERNLLIDKTYPSKFYLLDKLFECNWDTSKTGQRQDLYYTLHWLMKEIDVDRRNDWIKQLEKWNGYTKRGRKENICVQTEDLKHIDMLRITIGAHTVNHPLLSKLSMEDQRKEILTSKQQLEEILGHPVLTMSYPFGGVSDYNEYTIKLCKELGFSKVAANTPGIWSEGDDLYQIPRYIVRDWDLERFQKQIAMFWERK